MKMKNKMQCKIKFKIKLTSMLPDYGHPPAIQNNQTAIPRKCEKENNKITLMVTVNRN